MLYGIGTAAVGFTAPPALFGLMFAIGVAAAVMFVPSMLMTTRMVPDEVAPPGSSGGVQEDSAQDASWRLTEALLDRLKSRVETEGAELVIAVADTDSKTTDLLTQFCAARECRLTDAKPALQSAEAAGKQVRLVGDPHLAAAGQVILAESLLPLLRIP